jgi:hypothetical protein
MSNFIFRFQMLFKGNPLNSLLRANYAKVNFNRGARRNAHKCALAAAVDHRINAVSYQLSAIL